MHWFKFTKKELSTITTMIFFTIALNVYLSKSYGNLSIPIVGNFSSNQVTSIENEKLFFKDCKELYYNYIDELAVSLTNEKHPVLSLDQFELFLNQRSEYFEKLNKTPQNQKLLTYFTFKADIEKTFGKQTIQKTMMVKNNVLMSTKSECEMSFAI